MVILQSDLIRKAEKYQVIINEDMKVKASQGRVKSAFLCHSHKDETLIKGLIAYFQEAGITLYIDWKDHSMPDIPNAVTAKKIQNAINSYNLFIFLATANAKASRWCPWEIGYADSSKRKIFIIPTRDGGGTYGNEYLQLYTRVEMGKTDARSGLAIYEVDSKSGKWLSEDSL